MRQYIAAGIASALVGGTLVAQPPRLTEAEFLSVLESSHPAIIQARSAADEATASVLAAKVRPRPELTFVRENPRGDGIEVEQTDWTLSWAPFPRARRSRVQAAQAAAQAAEHSYQADVLSLRLVLREAFANWAIQEARGERLAGIAERVQTLARREATRFERGESSGLVARRLGIASSELLNRLALVEAAKETARAEALKWRPDVPPTALPELPSLPPPTDSTHAHPRLAQAEASVRAATLEEEAANRLVALPELIAGWQRQETSGQSLDGPVLGLSWSVPLFDRNQAERARSSSRLAGEEARLETVRRELEARHNGAASAYRRLLDALEDSDQRASDWRSILEGGEASFRLGESSLTDLLEIYRSVSASEMAALDLYEAALEAHRTLETLQAKPLTLDGASRAAAAAP